MDSELLNISRDFKIYRNDGGLTGICSADSLEEAEKKFKEMCLKIGYNFENYWLEETETSKLLHEKMKELR